MESSVTRRWPEGCRFVWAWPMLRMHRSKIFTVHKSVQRSAARWPAVAGNTRKIQDIEEHPLQIHERTKLISCIAKFPGGSGSRAITILCVHRIFARGPLKGRNLPSELATGPKLLKPSAVSLAHLAALAIPLCILM